MTTPVLNPRVLLTKIKKIEQKQAKRYPHLIERLEQIEQRLYALENRQNATNYMSDAEMDYSGAFESDNE
jgi:inhibitor of KinA sporulation pathway (predicted exonuclease)